MLRQHATKARRRGRSVFCAVLFALVSATCVASAQEPDAATLAPHAVALGPDAGGSAHAAPAAATDAGVARPPASGSATPPTVAQAVQAPYPEAARAQHIEGTVELLVTIAIDGTVAAAEVARPAGHGFDEAALDAVKHFRFHPARREGMPIASRIRYLYEFQLPKPAEPLPLPPMRTGQIAGKVVSDRDGAAIVSAHLTITERATQIAHEVQTDAEGKFALSDLVPGGYRLQIVAIGLQPGAYQELVAAGQETAVVYRLVASADAPTDDEYGASAVVAAPPREVSRRSLERTLMYRIPGTGNDPIRAVEVLPGVARPPFGSGQLIVRGSSPQDSLVLVDGVPVPQLYHFGGLRSVFNGQMLRGVTLYPGNFSSRFGRVSGGVFEVELRDPQTDRAHGVVDLSLIETSLMVETPITKRFAVAASVKRSMLDLVLQAVPSAGFTALPTYYDYQLMAVWRPTDHDQLRFSFYGSSDRFGLVTSDDSEANATAAKNAIDLKARFNYMQATWKRQIGSKTDQLVTVQAGPTLSEIRAGEDFKLYIHWNQVYGRAEWLTRLAPNVRLVAGMDLLTGNYRAEYAGPGLSQGEGDPDPTAGAQVGARAEAGLLQPGGYADLAVDFGPVTINGALRADYYHEIKGYSIDPRLVIALGLNAQWTLKAGAGLYTQPPQVAESNKDLGNPNLDPLHNAQFSTALNYEPADGVNLGLEGFYKQIWQNVVAGRPGEPPFTNDGVGRIYGLEASAQVHPPGKPYTGIASYTLLNSERKDHDDLPWRAFDYQQTHGFTLALLYQFPRGYEAGAAARYFTGNPYTPTTGRVFNSTTRDYQPLYGPVNSARNPSFNRIDLRLQKTWTTRTHTIALYLDVQNLLNHKNQEAVFYNYDHTQHGKVTGLPIIPAIGVRGQF